MYLSGGQDYQTKWLKAVVVRYANYGINMRTINYGETLGKYYYYKSRDLRISFSSYVII